MQQPITITLNLQLKLKVKLKDNKAEAEIIDAESEQVEDDDMLLKRKLALMLSTAFAEWSGYPLICNGSKGTNLINYKMWGKTVQQEIPDEYTQLEYIQSSGTQYIDTGITPTQSTKVSVDVSMAEINLIGIIGSRLNYGIDGYSIFTRGFNDIRFDYGTHTGTFSTTTYSVDEKMSIVKDGIYNYVNGVQQTSDTAETFSNSYSMYLGAINSENGLVSGYLLKGKIYSCKIWQDGTTLSRDFIPAKRNSDEVVGMYDKVSGVFFTNAGKGSFTSGDLTPSPTEPVDIISVGDEVTDTSDPNYGKYKIPVYASNENLFDKNDISDGFVKIEDGTIDGTGPRVVWRTSAYIEVLPNTSYYLYINNTGSSETSGIVYYDSNKTYISGYSQKQSFNRAKTTPANAKYVRFSWHSTQQNINTIFFAQGETIPFATTNIYLSAPLRKVGDYADYIDFENQQVVRNVEKLVLVGNESYIRMTSSTGLFSWEQVGMSKRERTPLISTHFTYGGSSASNWGYIYTVNGYIGISNIDFHFSDLAGFKAWLAAQHTAGTPVEVVYPLATPTTESITLPALPTFDGYTKFETSTTVKPSNMYGKG